MKKRFGFLLLVVLLANCFGCAGTIPSADFKKPIPDNYRLCANDETNIKLMATDGVVLDDIDRQRLESRIRQTINTKKKNTQCNTSDKRSFILDSKITRYDKGNAFARAMLAGLGQIHIDGDFSLLLLSAPENTTVAEFTLQKTFAWGGIYGGMTRIEDIEETFAAAIAESIVGQASKKTEQTATSQKQTQKAEK